MKWASISLCALTVASLGVRQVARSRTFQTFGRLVHRVETDRRIVALTFDDGPTAGAIDEVLAVLESRHVRATFFVNGSHWKLLGLPWYLWRTGRTSVTWDVEPDSPPFGTDPARIAAACRAVRPGSIILLHVWYGGREPSRAALPVILDRLRADGYELVTVRELLYGRITVPSRRRVRPHE